MDVRNERNVHFMTDTQLIDPHFFVFRDKSVWIWDVDQEEEEYSCASVLQAHTQDVKKVVWHPELDVVASCRQRHSIFFVHQWRLVGEILFSFVPPSNFLVSVSDP